MTLCPHCARSIESTSQRNVRRTCPHCGESLSTGEETPWIDLARVTNLAEAGFLTDELIGLGVDARIHQMNEFSAVTDRWATVYFIRVPSEVAPEAAAQIRQHLVEDATADEDDTSAVFRFSAMEGAVDPTFWRPVALVVLAGVASFVLGQHFSEQNGRRSSQGNTLSTAIDRIGRPLLSEPGPGIPRHRLWFDRQRAAWYLDADEDGDGLFDSRQRFHASGAAW